MSRKGKTAAAVTRQSEGEPAVCPGGNIVAGIHEGNRLPTVPEFQMAAAMTFRQPVWEGVGYFTGVWQP